MTSIKFEYSIEKIDTQKILSLKILGESMASIESAYLFGDISESLFYTFHSHFSIDLSNLTYISSSCFGTILNIINLSEKLNKKIEFKFNDETIKMLKNFNMEKILSFSRSINLNIQSSNYSHYNFP